MIARYMYIPLGGKQKLIYNIWIIFTFVAFWHDIKLHLLAWGWIIAIFLIPEYIFTKIFTTKEVILNS
jgi:D-alanyl-lipoteichoic acid acyltransferase DltB (MBOAT superfamily)